MIKVSFLLIITLKSTAWTAYVEEIGPSKEEKNMSFYVLIVEVNKFEN